MIDLNWLSSGAALVDAATGDVVESNSSFRELCGFDDEESQLEHQQQAKPIKEKKQKRKKNMWNIFELTTEQLSSEKPINKDISIQAGRVLEVKIKHTTTLSHNSTKTATPSTSRSLCLVEVHDITKRVQMDERALNFLELSFDGFWDWHMKTDYEYMSPRFWEMFGYEPHEKKHSPSEWQNMIFQEDIPNVMATLQEHITSRGATPYRNECRYRHKDGSTVVVYCNGRIIEWDPVDGSPTRMIGTHTDITELRRRQKIATEHKIHEYLAHKVRNPLTRAVEALGFLQATISSEPPLEDVTTIHSSLMEVSSILGRLAQLHKIHNGDIHLYAVPTRIHADIVEPVLQMCYENMYGSTHVFHVQKSDANLVAHVDGLRVKQALYGILEGAYARHVRDENDTKINVIAEPDPTDENSFRFVVEDSSPLQAEEEDDDLLLGTASDGVRYSGLHPSVYVARALVQQMKGTFTLEAKSLGGLKIITRIPGRMVDHQLNEQNHDETKEEWSPPAAATGIRLTQSHCCCGKITLDEYYRGARCLVVDDDRVVRKMLERRLTAIIPQGQIDTVSSGEDCIRRTAEHDYALIIMDHYMVGPGRPLTGAETICQLRLRGIQSPIIGCSANDVSALHLEAGANSFLQKPPTGSNERFIQILNSVVPHVKPQPSSPL